ncbi:DUF456 domain-containing protein [Gordonia sp. ABSL1-1]|uniref:DUF456 domain-containing protein n=1 Tax=Gordonia sp. ABSL1-1 TaxID=3053923 RepID=UPI0025744F2C|nr:DUF456 domain-containing protein [Gordonia sp. ABSL1-1]MDL9937872.1 DUF456 domain-containing protein [Gordonia sp. ABSL1-1]
MRKVTTLLGLLAAFVVALLLVPVGTAGASPVRSVNTGASNVEIAPNGESITVTLRDGKFVPNQAANEVRVVNARGQVTETVPLTLKSANGQVVHVASALSADGKSAKFTALDRQPVAKKKSKRMTKEQAYMKMMYQLNKDWPCAAPYVIGGLIIGFFVIVGWIIGGLIGAYIGYTTCNHGAAWRAAVNWWNTP